MVPQNYEFGSSSIYRDTYLLSRLHPTYCFFPATNQMRACFRSLKYNDVIYPARKKDEAVNSKFTKYWKHLKPLILMSHQTFSDSEAISSSILNIDYQTFITAKT